MNKHVQRALQLIHVRPDLAAKELRQAIAQEPDDGYTHGLLASCLLDAGAKEQAFFEARQCIKLSPNSPVGFHTLAHCHFQTGEMIEAEVAVEEALRLDPFEPSYWGLLSNIEIQNHEYEKALKAADNGLELDPLHAHCHNLRALILTKLGKGEQAQGSMDTAMAVGPENALTHAYRGWTLLEKHQFEESRQHFREALRLDPTMEWARMGMIQALEMRNWAYQLHLRVKFRYSWLVVILWLAGNIHLIGVARTAAAEWHIALSLLCFASWILCGVFTFFVLLPYTLINTPILRFLLQFDPDGQYALTREEKRFNSHLVGFLVTGIVLTIVGIVSSVWWPLALAGTLYIATLPLSYPDATRGSWKVWTCHLIGACVAALCFFGFAHGEGFPGFWRTVVIFNCFKIFSFPAAIGKLSLGVPVMKMLASAPVIKGLVGAVGLGALSQTMREKEKQKAREKMLKDANSPPNSK